MIYSKTLAIIGCDANGQITEALSSLGFCVQILPRHNSLPRPVSSHADMLIFEMGGCVFAERKYIEGAKSIFDTVASFGYDVIPCDISLDNKYPDDIAFNMALCNNVLYGNTKHNASNVIEFAKANGIKINDVKQGYTKCSTVVLGNAAIITADGGIASAAERNGIAVLTTKNSPDSVTLSGYSYGFIGGACGVYNGNVYFTGNIELHPQGDIIKSFCQSLGYSTVNLSDSKLVDVGGIIFLPYID